MSFRNTYILDTFKVKLIETINMSLPKNSHITYSHKNNFEKKLFTFQIRNTSQQKITFELERLEDNFYVDIIKGLKPKPKYKSTQIKKKLKANLQTIFTPLIENNQVLVRYKWMQEGEPLNSNTITLEPYKETYISLFMDYDFNCKQSKGKNRNQEIGFISKINKFSSLLKIRVVSKNLFKKQTLSYGNIFEKYNLSKSMLYSTRASGVSREAYKNDSFTLFFRNKQSFKGAPFNHIYWQKNIHLAHSHNFHLNPLHFNYRKKYIFVSKTKKKNYDTCFSYDIGK